MSGSLKLLSSMAPRELLAASASRFEAATGHRVSAEAAGGVDVAKRVAGGEIVDVVVLAADALDKLIAVGALLASDRVDLMKSDIAAAVRAGAVKPDIETEDAVKRAVLRAATLSYSTGPSGAYLEGLFERWGILQQLRPRIVVPPPGVPVGSLIAGGAVELGFQQWSELVNLAGVEVLGPLPPSIQSTTVYSGAVAAASRTPDLARQLLAFMAAAAA